MIVVAFVLDRGWQASRGCCMPRKLDRSTHIWFTLVLKKLSIAAVIGGFGTMVLEDRRYALGLEALRRYPAGDILPIEHESRGDLVF